jgi:hypothetical protein
MMKLTKNNLQEAVEKALIEEAITDVFNEDAAEVLDDTDLIDTVKDPELKKKLANMMSNPDSKDYVNQMKVSYMRGEINDETLAWVIDKFTKTPGGAKDTSEAPYKDVFKQLAKDLDIETKITGKMANMPNREKKASLMSTLAKLRSMNRKIDKKHIPAIAKMLRRGNFSKEELSTISKFLIGKKVVAEAQMQLVVESYYAIDVDQPLSVEAVAANWNGGEKPYDEAEYHAIYPLEDVLEYRDFEWMEEAEVKSPEEYNKVLQNVKELGRIEAVVIHVGINGQAVVADGNNRLAVAQQVNIKEVPVKFVFLQDAVRKASKITLEPAEIHTPTEETEKDSYYMR